MERPFGPNTRLYAIRHCRQFRNFRKYVLAPRQFAAFMQVYRLADLRWFYPLHAQDTADALNVMRCRAEEGSFFYVPFSRKDTGLYAFLLDREAPFVLIMPGGGYGDVCSLIEGYSTALKFNALGVHALIVNYSVGKIANCTDPADDVAEALRFALAKREEWKLRESYAVCGFSAGGHLAACWGTDALGYRRYGLPRPEAVILAYPVVTAGNATHPGSMKRLFGKRAKEEELYELYSVEKQVTADYPPTFLWQCKGDTVVPFANSLLMVEPLEKCGVPHLFMPVEGTAHGWGAGVGAAASGWIGKAFAFWKNAQEKTPNAGAGVR